MLKDEHILTYYPHGKMQKSEVMEKVKWDEVSKWILSHDCNTFCHISMSKCLEWLYVFHRFGEQSKKYTKAQIEMISKEWIKDYPELLLLHTSEGGKKIVENMLETPQTKVIPLGLFQDILKEKKNE